MKLTRLRIRGFQQFQDVDLDFTDPETGEPLEAICFLGPNGTGKSTLLRALFELLRGWGRIPATSKNLDLSAFNSEQARISCNALAAGNAYTSIGSEF